MAIAWGPSQARAPLREVEDEGDDEVHELVGVRVKLDPAAGLQRAAEQSTGARCGVEMSIRTSRKIAAEVVAGDNDEGCEMDAK